jgi:hypothetical protein
LKSIAVKGPFNRFRQFKLSALNLKMTCYPPKPVKLKNPAGFEYLPDFLVSAWPFYLAGLAFMHQLKPVESGGGFGRPFGR